MSVCVCVLFYIEIDDNGDGICMYVLWTGGVRVVLNNARVCCKT